MSEQRRTNGARPSGARAPAERKTQARPKLSVQRTRRQSFFSRLPDDTWKLALAGLLILAVAVGLTALLPRGFVLGGASEGVSESHASGSIRLSELMTSNPGVVADESGRTPDWVEVINTGASPVNLYGYAMSKRSNADNVYYFPDLSLAPGECVVVFADGVDSAASNGTMHAPFRLSSSGGSLMLFNRKGTAIDTVNYPSLSAGDTYARESASNWSISDSPTPGYPNTEEGARQMREPNGSAGVEISEVVAANVQYAPDENGLYQDYVELHNVTEAVVDLSGWFLSDDPSRPLKWRLPEGFLLEAGEYRIVYASGSDLASTAAPHASFRLSTENEAVVLSDREGRLVDAVNYELLKTNQALLRTQGGWTLGEPSPGAPNS